MAMHMGANIKENILITEQKKKIKKQENSKHVWRILEEELHHKESIFIFFQRIGLFKHVHVHWTWWVHLMFHAYHVQIQFVVVVHSVHLNGQQGLHNLYENS